MPTRPTITRTAPSQGNSACGMACAVVFFGLFVLIGSIFSLSLFLGMSGVTRLVALFPLIFVCVGVLGIWAVVRSKRMSPERTALGFRKGITQDIETDLPIPKLQTFMGKEMPVRLGVESTQWAGAFGLLFATVFWNGIVGVFVAVGIFTDEFPWFIWLFLAPFIVVGLVLAVAMLKQVLVAVRIPKMVVEVNHEPACPGELVRVSLRQAGSFFLTSLKVQIQCMEKVAYTRGTDSYREDRQLWSDTIFEGRDIRIEGERPFRETLEFRIPPVAMHSFHAEHNQIEWKMTVKGAVRGWPDYEYSFPFRVMPAGMRETMSWKRLSLSD